MMLLQIGNKYGLRAGEIPVLAKKIAMESNVKPIDDENPSVEPKEVEESNFEKVQRVRNKERAQKSIKAAR
jgi:hypothetical protein